MERLAMAGRWFRLYDDVINDPKVMRISIEMRWRWIELLCCASKNDGKIPSQQDLAFMLRVKPQQTSVILTELVHAGLVDRKDGGYAPHNWDRRQWKSDVKDPTAAERKRRQRQRERDISVTSRRDDRDGAVPVSRPDTEQSQKQNGTDDDGGDEELTPAKRPRVNDQAQKLAERLLVIAGHHLDFRPPGWFGAPLRVQVWLDRGWQPEIIEAAVKAGVARKPGQVASSVQYFERSIAEEHARQAAPLPNIVHKPQENVYVAQKNQHARPESLGEVASRLADSRIGFGPRPSGLRDLEGGAALWPLSQG
jgi:hypothetical protein